MDQVHARDAGEIVAIGISGGGPVDPEAGRILSIPNLEGWEDVPVTRDLSEQFSAPAFLENDANACALAEWKYGAGRGSQNLAFLTCSTGIGAGLILDGRLFRGASSLAGEVAPSRLPTARAAPSKFDPMLFHLLLVNSLRSLTREEEALLTRAGSRVLT